MYIIDIKFKNRSFIWVDKSVTYKSTIKLDSKVHTDMNGKEIWLLWRSEYLILLITLL